MAGAGTHLHRLIEEWTGQKPNLSCKCAQWIRKMDKEGVAWCAKHCDTIVQKLVAEAQRRAKEWRAAPVDEHQNVLSSVIHRAWTGAFLIPGMGMLLSPFVKMMVDRAISLAERDGAP